MMDFIERHSDAADELARLEARIAALRGVLAGLQQDVALAEQRLSASRASPLVQANERLVVAALSSQTHADTLAGELDAASRRAEHDALTQLPNRALLLDRCTQAMARSKRHGTRFALLFLDLDRFKQINDEHGHAAGDEALRQVARRLTEAVRAVDTVSRHSGDEFVVLLVDLSQARDAGVIADKLQAALAAPARPDESEFHLRASIGISVYPDHGTDLQALIAHADSAMYEAKRRRPGGVSYHGEPVAEG